MPRRPDAGRPVLGWREIPSRSLLRLLYVRSQCRELSSPERIRLREPGFQLRHGLGSKAVDAHARVELVALLRDEPTLTQRLEMPAHGRKREARRLGKLSSPARPLAEQVDHPSAVRIGERGERTVETLSAHVGFWNLQPVAVSISSWDTCRTV